MQWLHWLEHTPIANEIRTSVWMYAALETTHYIGLSFLVGGVMLIDLRVLGVAPKLPLKSMIGLLPWVWAGFIINATTGTALFIYGATSFGLNKAFWLKMVLIVLAGANALAFHAATKRSSRDWVSAGAPPISAKLFATASFLLWLGVVTAGRWMAYV